MRVHAVRTAGYLVLLFAAASLSAGVDGSAVLETTVPSFSEAEQTPYMVLMKLATEFSVPIGFEGIAEYPEKAVTVTVVNGTVRTVIERLTSADPRYEWQVTPEGLVDIFPKNAGERLLDVKVSRYRVKNSSRQQALDDLLKTPEFTAALAAVGVTVRTPFSGTFVANGCVPRFSLELNDVSMRTAINDLARASGSAFWSATRYGSALQYLSLPIAGSYCYDRATH